MTGIFVLEPRLKINNLFCWGQGNNRQWYDTFIPHTVGVGAYAYTPDHP
jgi:hypothetical protein